MTSTGQLLLTDAVARVQAVENAVLNELAPHKQKALVDSLQTTVESIDRSRAER